MIFVNETPFSAVLADTVLDDVRKLASVVVRVTYEVTDARLSLAPEQPWRASKTPWISPVGPMEADLPFLKGGVDVFVFGDALAPGKTPVEKMEVRAQVGTFRRRALVTGPRRWVRRHGSLVASAPAPFLRMPLTSERAFGGTAEWDGLAVPWPDNPVGRGFAIDEAGAEGSELPNVEEADAPMVRWSDRPPPCGFGFCPAASAARLCQGLVFGDHHEIRDLTPLLFNAAYPPMIAPSARPGDPVCVAGVLHDGPLAFELAEPPCRLRLQFGARVEDRALQVEQIGVVVPQRRVFVTYRFPFRYAVRAGERRRATLIRGKD